MSVEVLQFLNLDKKREKVTNSHELSELLSQYFSGDTTNFEMWTESMVEATEEEFSLAQIFLESTAANGFESINRPFEHWHATKQSNELANRANFFFAFNSLWIYCF